MKTEEVERKKTFFQGSVATTIDILTKVMRIGIGITIARGFGPEGKGVYSLIITLIGFSSLIGSTGINFAHVYLLSSQRYSLELIIRNAFFFHHRKFGDYDSNRLSYLSINWPREKRRIRVFSLYCHDDSMLHP